MIFFEKSSDTAADLALVVLVLCGNCLEEARNGEFDRCERDDVGGVTERVARVRVELRRATISPA